VGIKKSGKTIICLMLEAQAKRLRAKNNFKIVAVVGSVGKTSTKLAIAKTLETNFRTQYQSGNYNDRLTAPLVLFGQTEPGIFDIAAWLRVLWRNQRLLAKPYPYDLVVLELGTDAPGQIKDFSYLRPELTVVSAIAPEHMEFFGTLEAVAAEELEAIRFSKQVLINLDDTDRKFLPTSPYMSYGIANKADYTLSRKQTPDWPKQSLGLQLPGGRTYEIVTSVLGQQGAKAVLAAAAVADMLGVEATKLVSSLQNISAVPGRMQLLAGQHDSTLIDDSYNSSPLATEAALDVLYAAPAKQRIAILGSMNEMGEASPAMHRAVGAYCDPKKLDLVVTVGSQANEYLAPVAEERGCHVQPFQSPYDAGAYVKTQLQEGAIILAKGSQNGVFTEEALKQLLADPLDAKKLVRQSSFWMKKKQAQFK
jgi:UDP-N-acetylmuramoyl-tripeptide--D-alanyl-D-alanine ligase